jgi:hypothetical protein
MLESSVLKALDNFKTHFKDGVANKQVQLKSLTSGDYQNLLAFFEQLTENDAPQLTDKILIVR